MLDTLTVRKYKRQSFFRPPLGYFDFHVNTPADISLHGGAPPATQAGNVSHPPKRTQARHLSPGSRAVVAYLDGRGVLYKDGARDPATAAHGSAFHPRRRRRDV